MSNEDKSHMNGAEGKKLTHKALQVAMHLHERHDFHLAVATDGAKRGEITDRMEPQKISETTYGAWLGPESAEILKKKREKATALQQRQGIRLNQTDMLRVVGESYAEGWGTRPQQQKRSSSRYLPYSKKYKHNKQWNITTTEKLGS
eukprot:5112828-Pleurochrysis_carterae.AAC.1